MASVFEEAHDGQLYGSLTTADRLIIHGHLRSFYAFGLETFLIRQGIHINKGYKGYVFQCSERLRRRASEIAQRAGRPFIYQDRVVKGKDDLAREIARRDGVKEGLICVFSTLELATSFELIRGRLVPRQRKCLHFYFYLIDRELGFMHVRLQSWFPFQMQVYVNGREWLARRLDRRGIAYERDDNTLLWVADLKAAQRLCERFSRLPWIRMLDAMAHRVNPLLPRIHQLGYGSYYWAIDQCEVATDVMWKSRRGLVEVLGDLFEHALRNFSAKDVLRFLGRKRVWWKTDVRTRCHMPAIDRGSYRERRPESHRIKHAVGRNWIKMYDKWSVLRVETVINDPRRFRVRRSEVRGRRRRSKWLPMAKGIQNLYRYLQVGQGANVRYLEALVHVRPSGRAIAELDALCRSRVVGGRRQPKMNPVAPFEARLFESVMAGEHKVNGMSNHELRQQLYGEARDPLERKRLCARTSRLLSKLRQRHLIAKVPGRRLYRVTAQGHRVMGAALRFRRLEFPRAMAAAA